MGGGGTLVPVVAKFDPGDKPWTPTPHKGWNKKTWLKLKKKEDEFSAELNTIWNQLTGNETPAEVRIQAVVLAKAKKLEPVWNRIELNHANQLVKLYNEEIQRRYEFLRKQRELLLILLL